MKCKSNEIISEGKCVVHTPEYSDKVRFYRNEKSKVLITSKTEYLGKGWCESRVGRFSEKQRGKCDVSGLLNKHYPGYKEVSVFTEDSYHKPKSGKITNYGTKKYNLEFSKLKPINSPYEVSDNILSTSKDKFGKPLKKIQFHEWENKVLNWRPEGNSTKLWVKHSISNPLTGEDKVIYKSEEYDEKDADQVIKLFKDKVSEVSK